MKRKGELQKVEGTVYRAVQLKTEAIDEEKRTIKLSFSSELPVLRAGFFATPWMETLGHKRSEVNLERMVGAPVLYNHQRTRENLIGVVESAKIVKGRGEATIRISSRDDVGGIWHDIRDGVLTNVSVGYNINERKLTRKAEGTSPDEYRVTRWTPAEISVVDIPADHTVGIGRNEDGKLNLRVSYPDLPREGEFYRVINLDTEEVNIVKFRKDSAGNLRDEAGNIVDEEGNVIRSAAEAPESTTTERVIERTVEVPVDASAEQIETAKREGAKLEGERRAEISGLLDTHASRFSDEQLTELRAATIDAPECSVEKARGLILDALGKESKPVQMRAEITEDAADKFKRGASIAVMSRAGMGVADDDAAMLGNEFRGFVLVDLARHALEMVGVNTAGLSRMEIAGRAFTTSDFPLILADSANKSMLKGFDEAPETWGQWCNTGNLSDFKAASRVGLSSFDDLEQVNEDGEYKYGQFDEHGETIQLATYGKLFAISRQAIINDDLRAFTAIPARMGRAASRVAGDLAYGVLTGNPNMSDGVALFNAAHNNLQSASVIDVAAVSAARTAMALQKDSSESSHGSNITPATLLCPVAVEDTANVLRTSEFDPDDTNNSRAPNPHRNKWNVVSDARLDADSATAWYMIASNVFDTVEVAFLDGNAAPTLESQRGWSKDGTEFKVRIDVAAAPLEWRTMQKNPGA